MDNLDVNITNNLFKDIVVSEEFKRGIGERIEVELTIKIKRQILRKRILWTLVAILLISILLVLIAALTGSERSVDIGPNYKYLYAIFLISLLGAFTVDWIIRSVVFRKSIDTNS